MLELSAHRKAPGDARDLESLSYQQLADVVRGGLALDREVGGEDDLAHDAIRHALHEAIEMDLAWPHAVERRQASHQYEIESRIALRLLHHQQVAGRFDDTQQRGVTP